MNLECRLLLLGFLLIAYPVAGIAGNEAPLIVDADDFEADQTREISVFKGNVSIQKGAVHILADEVRLKAKDGELQSGTIIGSPARFEQMPEDGEPIKGRAKRIEYDAANEIVVLTGEAWVNQGGDEFSGETIRYDLVQEKVLATSSESTPQRVRIIFTPRNNQESEDNGSDETTENR
ncbi:MAG: lipopolysaccharide transport periplasmic protein LptA [Gammaproteobacteria bacterium]|nr:lipopolysaccharide transport periplasmic protein LptA [Gammaproteobacteria bacterium]